ncbi:MAG: helix-turn-helix domain-containing protein [Eggerthellaceae bacterium]|nr:helix-turn-helix domain-containing protein [Eggerthellaceae bacterium]
MRLDGSVLHYLLEGEFGDVACDKQARRASVGYPVIYEDGADMAGHTVLVSKGARPSKGPRLDGSVLVCANDKSATRAHEAGLSVIQVCGDVSFSGLCNFLQMAFMRFERLEARLRTCVDTHAGVQALIDACALDTGCPLALVDEHYRLIYESAHNGVQPDLLQDENIDLFMASHQYCDMRVSKNVFAVPGSGELLMKNVFSRKQLKGTLISRHAGDAVSARYVRFVLDWLCGYIEDLHAGMGSFGMGDAESDRIRAGLSRLLPGGTANQSEIQMLLLEGGHAPENRYVVLRIERSFTHEGAEELEYLLRRLEQAWLHAYCYVADDALFMLVDIGNAGPEGGESLQGVLTGIRDSLAKAGMSRPFSAMDRLDAARMQATAALAQGGLADPALWVYRFDDYALPWLLEHGKAGLPADYVAHPAVTALLQYDAAHETELLRTLSVFGRCRYNATKASDELYVARSTLLNRLERAVELTGLDLDDADERLYVALSLAMLD